MRPLSPLVALAALAVCTLTSLHAQTADDPALRDPKLATAIAPKTFTAKFETTKGPFEVECTREWAPFGVDRFYNLVKIGFYSDIAFFRVMQKPKPFVVQFGIHGTPEVSAEWRAVKLPADEVKQSNSRGMLTYAQAGPPTTRTTQMFINFGNNANLDKMGFAPICKVKGDGMDVVDKLYSEYGGAPSDQQGEIEGKGNAFLREKYPELDYIKGASIVSEGDATPASDVKPAGGAGDTKDSGSTWIYVGLGVAGAVGVYLLMTMGKSKQPDKPPPAPTRPAPQPTAAVAKKKKKKKTGTGATKPKQTKPAPERDPNQD